MITSDLEIDVSELRTWKAMYDNLVYVKDAEMTMRKQISADVIKQVKDKGQIGNDANKVKIDYFVEDMKVTIKQGVNVNILKDSLDELDSIYDALSDEVRACFPKKISFNQSAYNKLSDDEKMVVDAFIIESPAAPSMEIVFTDG